jgi:hypothetical protein
VGNDLSTTSIVHIKSSVNMPCQTQLFQGFVDIVWICCDNGCVMNILQIQVVRRRSRILGSDACIV